jgi:hypothetical protein
VMIEMLSVSSRKYVMSLSYHGPLSDINSSAKETLVKTSIVAGERQRAISVL